MDPIETLSAALRAEPEDVAARCALTDELMERNGYSRHGAASLVGRIVNAARNARDVAAACRMLDQRTGAWPTMRSYILSCACVAPSQSIPIDVIPGTCFPMVEGVRARCEFPDGTHCSDPRAAFAAGIAVNYTPDTRRVTVGAGWIISRKTKPV